MVDTHTHFRENVAGYALGALDAAEVSALEAHLRTCKTCRADLAAYERVRGGLLSGLPPQAPPPSLRRRLQERLKVDARPVRRGISWSFNQLALAGALALLVGVSLFSILQVRAVQQQQAELEARDNSAQTAIAMLAYPGTQTIGFDENGISGSLLVDKQRGLLAIFAWHLPPAPAGKTYQVWLIDPQGGRTSGGFLFPEAGYPFLTAVIKSPAPMTGFTGLGVTTEPAGGSPAPTGAKLFGADF